MITYAYSNTACMLYAYSNTACILYRLIFTKHKAMAWSLVCNCECHTKNCAHVHKIATRSAVFSRCCRKASVCVLRRLGDVHCCSKAFLALFCCFGLLALRTRGCREAACVRTAGRSWRFYRGVHVRWCWTLAVLVVHLGAGGEVFSKYLHSLTQPPHFLPPFLLHNING